MARGPTFSFFIVVEEAALGLVANFVVLGVQTKRFTFTYPLSVATSCICARMNGDVVESMIYQFRHISE